MKVTLILGLSLTVPILFACPLTAIGPIRDKAQQASLIVAELGHMGTNYPLAFSSDGHYLLSGVVEEAKGEVSCFINRWDMQRRRIERKYATGNGVSLIACSPDGRTIATGSREEIRIIDNEGNLKSCFEDRKGWVECLGFLDKAHVFAAFSHAVGHQWNFETKRGLTVHFPCKHACLSAAAINRSGRVFAVWGTASIRIYRGQMNKPAGVLKLASRDWIEALAISDDGKSIAVAKENGSLLLFDLKRMKLAKEWKAHETAIFALGAIPGNEGFVSGDANGRIKIWNDKGSQIAQVHKYTGAIASLAFSPDGSLLASAGDYQRIVIWDLQKLLRKK